MRAEGGDRWTIHCHGPQIADLDEQFITHIIEFYMKSPIIRPQCTTYDVEQVIQRCGWTTIAESWNVDVDALALPLIVFCGSTPTVVLFGSTAV